MAQDQTFLTPHALAQSTPRIEANGPQGRIIHARGVEIGAGLYGDSEGKGHVAVHVRDPEIYGGERRVYLIGKAAALEMGHGLIRAAGRSV